MAEHVGLQMNRFIVHVDLVTPENCVKVCKNIKDEILCLRALKMKLEKDNNEEFLIKTFSSSSFSFIIAASSSFFAHCDPQDDFVIDTVVSSSELLSDVSDNNVITWGELKDITQDANSTDIHNAYIAAGILATALLILAIVVSISYYHIVALINSI